MTQPKTMPTTHFHIATLHTQNDADAVLFELQDLPCIHVADVQLLATHGDHPHVQRMLRFADGFVRLRQQNGQLWLTDLRMGQEGAYVFDFDLGPLAPQTQATRAVQHSQRAPIGKSLRWLWARMWGADLPALSAQDLHGGGN